MIHNSQTTLLFNAYLLTNLSLHVATSSATSLTPNILNIPRQYQMYCKAYEICYKNPNNIIDRTLGMLLHYLGKLKCQFFADI